MKIQRALLACAISVATLAANAATFTVTTNADSGAGSLRQAIIDANSAGTASTVTFALAREVATIRPLTPLPAVSANVTLDAKTPAGSPDNGGVEINGSLCTAPQSSGIVTSGKVSFLRFTNWNGYGIDAKGDAVVTACVVGIAEDGSLRPNANGVKASDRAHIGVDPAASPNVIAGNTNAGIVVNSSTAVLIGGNVIGFSAAPNAIGVLVEGTSSSISMNVKIGTSRVEDRNEFPLNTSADVEVRRATGVSIVLNEFGDYHESRHDYVGVRIQDSSLVSVTTNSFYSQRTGISVEGASSRNTLTGNHFYTPGIAIDLNADGPTANDDHDADPGPNGLQNYPALASAQVNGDTTTVGGTLNSAPNQLFYIHLYQAGENCGSIGLGYSSVIAVTTDSAGNAPFIFTTQGFFAGILFTATATDSSGNTSEFSNCILSRAHGQLGIGDGSGTMTEGAVSAAVTVVRTGGTLGAATIDYTTEDESANAGSDYTAVRGTLRFEDGESSKTITIPLLDDALFEGTETFGLVISNPTGGTLDGWRTRARITIKDNERRPLAVPADVSIVEGNSGRTDLTFVVTLQGPPSTLPLDFRYGTYTGTATPDADFVPTGGMMTFAVGQKTASVTVPIVGDTLAEADETFSFNVTSTASDEYSDSNGSTARGTIVNDDGINELRVEDVTVIEGDSGIRNISVRITASSPFTGRTSIATVDGTAIAGSDYTGRGVELTWLNSKEESFALVTYGDPDPEDDETFQVKLSTSSTLANIVKPIGLVTIQNDDPQITPMTFSIARGTKKSITVKLARPATSDAALTVTAAQSAAFAVPAQILVGAGTQFLTFDVTALAAPASSRIDVIFPTGLGDRIVSMNVTSFEPVTLDLRPSPVKVAVGASVTITASMSPAVADEQTITLTAGDPHTFAVQPSITIPPGGNTTFTVTGREAGSSGLQAALPLKYGGGIVTLFVDVVAAPAAPLLLAVTPGNGPPSGGSTVTLSGSRIKSDCSVTFDGAPAQATFVSESQFTAISPAHAPGTVDVRLSCSSGTSVLTSAFTYLATGPALASVTPATGNIAGGTIVKLAGTGLSSACGVFFDGVAARGVGSESATTLSAIAPPHSAATVNVSLRCGGTTTTLGTAFTYNAAEEPSTTITAVNPDSGSAGQTVTITGSRFRARDAVTFDTSTASLLSTTSDTHFVRIPDVSPGKVAVTITDPNGHVTTTGPIFTITAPVSPKITQVTPSNVMPGNELVVEGDGFRAGYTFGLGDRAATIISMSYTSAIIRVPPIDAGTYPLNIVNAAGNVAAIGPSIVVASHGVAVTDVSAACGSTDGGETITIRGSGFAAGASVTIANLAATNVIVVDANTITATTPISTSAGAARIVVTNANGDSGSLTGAFRYVSPFDPDGCGGMRRRVGSRS